MIQLFTLLSELGLSIRTEGNFKTKLNPLKTVVSPLDDPETLVSRFLDLAFRVPPCFSAERREIHSAQVSNILGSKIPLFERAFGFAPSCRILGSLLFS